MGLGSSNLKSPALADETYKSHRKTSLRLHLKSQTFNRTLLLTIAAFSRRRQQNRSPRRLTSRLFDQIWMSRNLNQRPINGGQNRQGTGSS
jgi:hypothetical protein